MIAVTAGFTYREQSKTQQNRENRKEIQHSTYSFYMSSAFSAALHVFLPRDANKNACRVV